jgi:hypothetical protein
VPSFSSTATRVSFAAQNRSFTAMDGSFAGTGVAVGSQNDAARGWFLITTGAKGIADTA